MDLLFGLKTESTHPRMSQKEPEIERKKSLITEYIRDCRSTNQQYNK